MFTRLLWRRTATVYLAFELRFETNWLAPLPRIPISITRDSGPSALRGGGYVYLDGVEPMSRNSCTAEGP